MMTTYISNGTNVAEKEREKNYLKETIWNKEQSQGQQKPSDVIMNCTFSLFFFFFFAEQAVKEWGNNQLYKQ